MHDRGEQQKPPEVLAEEFVSVMQLLYDPPASSQDEQMAQVIKPGEGLIFRKLTPDHPGKIPDDLATVIRSRALGLIRPTATTTPYQDHVLGAIDEQIENGALRMIGQDYLLWVTGVWLPERDYGIFDSKKAVFAEADAFMEERESIPLLQDDQVKHQQKMRAWEQAFRSRHRGKHPSAFAR